MLSPAASISANATGGAGTLGLPDQNLCQGATTYPKHRYAYAQREESAQHVGYAVLRFFCSRNYWNDCGQ